MSEIGKVPIVIGVTGHRNLREEDVPDIRVQVRNELLSIMKLCPNSPVRMLNCLAEGADQLCAEEAMALGIPVTGVLPMPLEIYEKDFCGESLAKLRGLVDKCDRVFVAPEMEPAPSVENEEDNKLYREFGYRQAGIYVAVHSHVMLALWDGLPGSTNGCGTADIVKVKLENTYIDRTDRRLHPADGVVIRIPVRRAGTPEPEEDNEPVFYGDRTTYDEVLSDTDAYNRDVANSYNGDANGSAIDFNAWSPAKGCDDPEDEGLNILSKLYMASDQLSLRNAKRHQRILALLAVAATVLTMAFLLYDEAELFWMIDVCCVMIILLFAINAISRRLKCHDKYLEYRVLTECNRVQTYLHFAGVESEVYEVMPWTLQVTTPWIRRAMAAVSAMIYNNRSADRSGSHSIRDIWVGDQLKYHRNALVRTEAKLRTNNRIVRTALVLTITVYVIALIYETRYGGLLKGGSAFSDDQNNLIRAIIKILMGTFSAGTLFTSNYYGKQALPNVMEDHRKMILLYEEALKMIDSEGEDPEFMIRLAQDELQETSNWYAYQSMNDADINI